mgnify:CR=1 FL=1|jgi:hypothetical protein
MTNYLGPYYPSNLLLDPLKATNNSRIISISSCSTRRTIKWDDINYEKSFNVAANCDSKLAQTMFSQEFNKKYGHFGIKAVSFHPGIVRTEPNKNYLGSSTMGKALAKLGSPLFWYFTKNPTQGSQAMLYCALEDHEELKGAHIMRTVKKNN